jgi:hypothetical protein
LTRVSRVVFPARERIVSSVGSPYTIRPTSCTVTPTPGSTVATDMMGVSGRAMIEALIAGERDPHVLAELARGRLRVKHAALVQALTGRFDAHHAELARILLDAYDAADAQIRRPNARIEAVIAALPAAQGVDADGTTGPHAGIGPNAPVLPALARLDEIPGVGAKTAQVIIAEIGLDMTRFPTAAHLVSWARLSPRTVQSGPRHRAGRTGKGNPYLKGVLSEAAAAAAKTDTFLGAPLPTPRQTTGQTQSPRRGRPLHPHHRLAPARRLRRRLPRPRRGLPHPPDRHRTAAPAATSANSRPSATKSPSLPQPNGGHQRLTVTCFPIRTETGGSWRCGPCLF